MTNNMRFAPAKKPIEVTAEEAEALMDKYGDRRSCKVQKLGLQNVVDALVRAGGRSTLVHKVLTDENGKYKADIGDGPVQKHVNKRCACFATKIVTAKAKR